MLAGRARDRLPWRLACASRARRQTPPVTPARLRTPANEDPIPMSSDLIKHVSDTSFDQDVLQSEHPVLVDFWAEWCGPCKMFAPILDEAAREYEGRLTVAKLDIDSNPATPGRYGIRGIPTVILYKGGQPHAQKVGAMSKSQLKQFLDSNL
jgi:thioredoxin 1